MRSSRGPIILIMHAHLTVMICTDLEHHMSAVSVHMPSTPDPWDARVHRGPWLYPYLSRVGTRGATRRTRDPAKTMRQEYICSFSLGPNQTS